MEAMWRRVPVAKRQHARLRALRKLASQVTQDMAAVSASFPVALDGMVAPVLPGSRH